MSANYDKIAPFYDGLSRLLFGNSIIRSQQFMLQEIKPKSNILIIGGGTGWILEEIAKLHTHGLKITYVDHSPKMIKMAQSRFYAQNEVCFLCQSIQTADLDGYFDIVIVPFLFDNFYIETIDQIFKKIEKYIHPDVKWLYADFNAVAEKPWTNIMLKVMYHIFRPVCNLETTSMPDCKSCFRNHNYQITKEASFYSGFISSVIYKKRRFSSVLYQKS